MCRLQSQQDYRSAQSTHGHAAQLRPVLLRPCHRSRHGQHLRLRPRAGHRPERAVGRRLQHGAQPDRSGRAQRQGNARAHAEQHGGDQAAARRGHRRLRRRRADAQRLHQAGQPAQHVGPAPRRHRRAGRDHAGRAARGAGEHAAGQGQRGLPDRRAGGGGDRRRPAHHRADRQHDRRHRRRHHRHRGHLDGRRRLQQVGARRRQRAGRGDHRPHAQGARPAHRRPHRRADQDRDRVGGAARREDDHGSARSSHRRRASPRA